MTNKDDGSSKYDADFGFDEGCEKEWIAYLAHFMEHIYPMFERHGFSRDAALTTWFTNRMRNAIPDDDVGNRPWETDESL